METPSYPVRDATTNTGHRSDRLDSEQRDADLTLPKLNSEDRVPTCVCLPLEWWEWRKRCAIHPSCRPRCKSAVEACWKLEPCLRTDVETNGFKPPEPLVLQSRSRTAGTPRLPPTSDRNLTYPDRSLAPSSGPLSPRRERQPLTMHEPIVEPGSNLNLTPPDRSLAPSSGPLSPRRERQPLTMHEPTVEPGSNLNLTPPDEPSSRRTLATPPDSRSNLIFTPRAESASNEVESSSSTPNSRKRRRSALLDETHSQPRTQRNSPITGVRQKGPQAQANTRGTPRLKPGERDPSVSKAERFCWNIGFWLDDIIGPAGLKTDFESLETIAGPLLKNAPTKEPRLADSEIEYLRDKSQKERDEYRPLRARILIGLCLIYQHNVLGNVLMRRKLTHPACRPDLEHGFRFCNMGRSQAQMVAYRSDVKRASAVWQVCVKAGYIPEQAATKSVSRTTSFEHTQEADEIWCALTRQTLYRRLEEWYESCDLPIDLRFVILWEELNETATSC